MRKVEESTLKKALKPFDVVKGESLEDAYANAFVALASGVRRMKNSNLDQMNRLTVM